MSRIGAMRNKIAGDAAVVLARPWARLALRQERHLPVGDIALWCQSQHGCGCRGNVSNKTQGATCPPLGAPATAGGSRAYVSIETKLRASRTASQTRLSARLALRRSVGGFGGSRRFFGTSRGNPVVLAPGIGRKIAAHTAGKAASPIRGISKGSTPWITFASFS